MSWWRNSVRENEKPETDRRKEPRISGRFKVRYSGSDEDQIVIGHSKIVDLSRHGFGLVGGRDLKPGMELALFLELPDTHETLCIPHAHVSWTNGRRFGVELRGPSYKEPFWLQCLAGQA